VKIPDDDNKSGFKLVFGQGPIDAFCPDCRSHSIFNRIEAQNEPHESEAWLWNERLILFFQCSRNSHHKLTFWIQVDDDERTIQKVGQFPSVADLNTHDVRKYRGVLDRNTFVELTKAIGLAAHGVGIGSFTYLRRIFENLVEEAHQKAMVIDGWDEIAYGKGRMDDKIKALSNYLPAFLVENRAMYGILSKGIHELSEEDCLKAFPAVKIGIEIILDAKLHAEAERKKLEEARRAIQALASGST
jgi:hypothetical protein